MNVTNGREIINKPGTKLVGKKELSKFTHADELAPLIKEGIEPLRLYFAEGGDEIDPNYIENWLRGYNKYIELRKKEARENQTRAQILREEFKSHRLKTNTKRRKSHGSSSQ